MPAKSKKQQQLMGMAYAYKKKKKKGKASKKVKQLAKHMSKKDLRDFAKTKTRKLCKEHTSLVKMLAELQKENTKASSLLDELDDVSNSL
jgi:pyruvoyl-dependent arginine decarboxylase (PvlArgDC)